MQGNFIAPAFVAIAFLCGIALFMRRLWNDRQDDKRTRRLAFTTHYSILKEEIEGLYAAADLLIIPTLHDQILDFSNSYKDMGDDTFIKGRELQDMLGKKEKDIRKRHQKEEPVYKGS